MKKLIGIIMAIAFIMSCANKEAIKKTSSEKKFVWLALKDLQSSNINVKG